MIHKKRGHDKTWDLIRYDDETIYAKCKCGFHYPCSNHGFPKIPTYFLPYCPICGSKKTYCSAEIKNREYDNSEWEVYDMSYFFKQEVKEESSKND